MTTLSSSLERVLLGSSNLASGAFGISSRWDALVEEIQSGTHADCNLIVQIETLLCLCEDDGCACTLARADIVGLYQGSGENRSLVGIEAVFSTPELLERAAAALHVSGVGPENQNYSAALDAIHAALRSEIAQWAPDNNGIEHGTLYSDDSILLGDAYMWPDFDLPLKGTLKAVWFLDDHEALSRLQLLLV
jgi:hypothetical protein